MTDLIARLEAAEAGSRELDTEVFRALEPWSDPERFYCACTGACLPDSPYYRGGCSAKPRLTTSLDAIVATIGEKLPGQYWAVTEHPDGFVATIGGPFHSQVKGVAMTTAPIALCIALLRAIKEGADG